MGKTMKEKVRAFFLNHCDSHGIYPVEAIQQKVDKEFPDQGIKVRGWKLTRADVKDIKKGGGWIGLDTGTKVTDGGIVLRSFMDHFKVKSTNSYFGRGRQYYSDLDDLMDAVGKLKEGKS